MNRAGLGLAIGAGYVLGRTKKMKLAFAVGTLVAGKRMRLNPRALAELASQQLLQNPQFKEIGDQLREDLRGVGKAASGAMVERQLDSLADRLHGRTAEVRDQLAGVAPDLDGEDDEEYADEDERSGAYDDEDEEDHDDASEEESGPRRERSEKAAPAKRTAKAPAKKAAAKKTAKTAAKKAAPAKKAAAKKAPARTAKKATRSGAAKKTAAARGAARGAGAGTRKGGGE
ncbi:DNA primase [Streptomyces sp. NPDC003635]